MKIVVLDGHPENPGDLSWSKLEQSGELVVYDRTKQEEVVKRIGDAELVIVNKIEITKEIMEQCPGLQYIGVLATGYNVIDLKAAKEKNIIVTNIPAYGTAAVAQFVFALLLEICHHPAHHSNAVYQGRWESGGDWCFWDYPLIELAGKTMGIIGFGKIGQLTGTIARAFGMKVLAYDRYPNEAGEKIAEYVDLDEMFRQADIISLHCPLFPETENLINKNAIQKMKDGVILINTSRGPLINEQDLAAALRTGKVYAAGLDVVSTEPIKSDNPLLTVENCIITPHIAWASKESSRIH